MLGYLFGVPFTVEYGFVFCFNVTTGFGGGQERKAEQKAARARREEEFGELRGKPWGTSDETGVSHHLPSGKHIKNYKKLWKIIFFCKSISMEIHSFFGKINYFYGKPMFFHG